ncbi:MAG: HAD-IIA family hydrolase [Candidatus Aenigmatarchaeota archaeon]
MAGSVEEKKGHQEIRYISLRRETEFETIYYYFKYHYLYLIHRRIKIITMDFSRFKSFVFDLDGTIWNWKELLPGAKELLENLRKKGKQVLFITNNTMLRRKDLVKKLKDFGVECKENELISSAIAISEYIKFKGGKVFVIGENLKEDLKEEGIEVDEENPRYVVVGHDVDFNFNKLTSAVRYVKKGAELIAAAQGRYFVFGDEFIPGTGTIVKAIEYTCNKRAKLLGKPSDFMCHIVQLFVQSSRKETVVFGDELRADIGLAKKCGYFSVLVKTGVDKEVKGEIRPDLAIDSLMNVKI